MVSKLKFQPEARLRPRRADPPVLACASPRRAKARPMAEKVWKLKLLISKPPILTIFVLAIFLILCLGKYSLANLANTAETYDVLDDPRASISADFNGDGKMDLAVTNYRVNEISILINKGDGTFLPAVNYSSGNRGPVSLAAQDFNPQPENFVPVWDQIPNRLTSFKKRRVFHYI